MTYLGLDLGSKTCGIAISDRTGLIASSLEVIRYQDYEELINKLNNIVISRNVDAFVLGNPKNLDGSLSKRSEITFEFKKILETMTSAFENVNEQLKAYNENSNK